MPFQNPLIAQNDEQRNPLTGLPIGGSNTPQFTPTTPAQPEINDWEPVFSQQAQPEINDWEPVSDQEGPDKKVQEMWAEYNRPEDEVPLSADQRTIPAFLGRTAKAIGRGAANAGLTAYGILENAVSSLAAIPIEAASGIAGMGHAALLSLENLANNKDPLAFDEAKNTVENLRAELNSWVAPSTQKGQEVREKMIEGAEATIGALAQWGKENIVEPAAEKAGEIAGPTAAGLTGMWLSTSPEFAGYLLTKGPVSGAVRQVAKGTKRAVGKAVDVFGVRPASKIGKMFGANEEAQAKYFPHITKESVIRTTKKILDSGMDDGVSYSKTVKYLEDEIPGYKALSPMAFEDPKSTRLFLDLAGRDREVGLALYENVKDNAEAARKYLRGIKESGTPTDVRTAIESERAKRHFELQQVQDEGKAAIAGRTSGLSYPETGVAFRAAFQNEAKAARDRATSILDELGDLNDDIILTDGLIADLKNAMELESFSEIPEKGITAEARKFVRELEKRPPLLSIRELYKNRKTIRKAGEDLDRSLEPNQFAVARNEKILGVIDDHMRKTLMEPGKAADIIKRFRRAYYEDYASVYETPTMTKIRKSNPKHGDFISNSLIGGKYFRSGPEGIDAARDFLTASNNNPGAMEAMTAYVNNDLARAVTDPDTGFLSKSKLNKWLQDYGPALDELGLSGNFENMKSILDSIDVAQNFVNEFDKRYISKILDADIDSEIDKILKSDTPRSDMYDIVSIIKSGRTPDEVQRGMRGLQNGFIDKIEDIATDSVNDVDGLEKFYKDHREIYKIVFDEAPEKLEVLENYVEAMRRNFPKGGLPENFSELIPVFREFYGSKMTADIVVRRMWHNTIGLLPHIGREGVRKLMRRLALDPNAAITLRRIGKDITRDKPEVADRRWKNYLLQIGLKASLQLGVPTAIGYGARTGEPSPPKEPQKNEELDRLMQRISNGGQQ